MRIVRIKFLIVFVLLCSGMYMRGQDLQMASRLESPTVSAFEIFNNIPVDMSTGIPKVSVPIHTYKFGDIVVPISLDYHASGVKVKDHSGLYGVKWNLNAAGIINCSDLYNTSTKVISNEPYSDYVKEFFDQILNGQIRTRPYMYSINYPGGSFKAYIEGHNGSVDNDRRVMLQPVQKGIIVELEGNVKKVIDEKGFLYLFSTKEVYSVTKTKISQTGEETLIPLNNTDNNNISAYFLDMIISPKKDTVRFIYEDNEYRLQNRSESKYYLSFNDGNSHKKPDDYTVISNMTYLSKRLVRIESNSGSVVKFKYDEFTTEEINKGTDDKINLLTSIDIISYEKTIKSYKIDYTNKGKYSISDIRIYGKDNKYMSEYSFAYNGGTIPSSDNTGVDYFGYYNGREFENAGSLIPRVPGLGGIANRSFYYDMAKIGMLKEITYPTGAKQELVFEPHNIKVMKGIIPEEYLTSVPKQFGIRSYSEEHGEKIVRDTFVIGEDAIEGCDIYTSEEMKKQLTTVKVKAFGISFNEEEESEYGNSKFYGRIIIRSVEDFPNHNDITLEAGGAFEKKGDNSYVFNHEVCLRPGKYTAEARTLRKGETVSINLSWKEKPDDEDYKQQVNIGGFRIKNIIVDKKDTISYTYGRGLICNLPQYYAPWHRVHVIPNPPNMLKGYSTKELYYTQLFSDPVREIGTTNGSYVSYNRVTEKRAGNGYIVNEFSNQPDNYEFSVYMPLSSNAYKRSKLISKTYYAEGATGKDFNFKELYFHNFEKDNKLMHGLVVRDDNLLDNNYGVSIETDKEAIVSLERSFQTYNINSSAIELDSVLTVERREGQDIVSRKYFTYNSRGQQSEVRNVTMKGASYGVQYRYPVDYSREGIAKVMVDRNMINYPFEAISFRGDNVTGSKLIKYDIDRDKVVPFEVFNLDIAKPQPGYTGSVMHNGELKYDNRFRREISVELYDDKGNALYYKNSKGNEVCCIYGYNKELLLAIIEGVDYSVLESALDNIGVSVDDLNSVSVSAYPNKDDLLRDKFKELREYLTEANVVSYTHIPLIGMSSVTDENGVITYYKYDDFGRLSYVLDNDKNIIKSSDLHFKATEVNSIVVKESVGGVVEYDNTKRYYIGDPVTFNVIPDEFHIIGSLKINGIDMGNVSSYTLPSLGENCVVEAQFVPNYYTVSISSTSGGTVSPGGSLRVVKGGSKVFNLKPDAVSKVKRVLANGQLVLNNEAIGGFDPKPFDQDDMLYTLNGISSDINLTVEFEPKKYATTTTVLGLGSSNVQPMVSFLNHGSSHTWTFENKPGYDFIGIRLNGQIVTSSYSYTATNITSDKHITAEYRMRPVTGRITNSFGGGIMGATVTIYKVENTGAGQVSTTLGAASTDGNGAYSIQISEIPTATSHAGPYCYIKVEKDGVRFDNTPLNINISGVYNFSGCELNYVTLDKNWLSFEHNGGMESVKLTACNNWTVTKPASATWVTILNNPGSGSGNITIQVSSNASGGIGGRVTTLTLHIGSTTKTIHISQKGKGMIDPPIEK